MDNRTEVSQSFNYEKSCVISGESTHYDHRHPGRNIKFSYVTPESGLQDRLLQIGVGRSDDTAVNLKFRILNVGNNTTKLAKYHRCCLQKLFWNHPGGDNAHLAKRLNYEKLRSDAFCLLCDGPLLTYISASKVNSVSISKILWHSLKCQGKLARFSSRKGWTKFSKCMFRTRTNFLWSEQSHSGNK